MIHPPKAPRAAIAMLTLCCLCWGYSFPVMQIAADAFSRAAHTSLGRAPTEIASRAAFNALRFALATILYVVLASAPRRSAVLPVSKSPIPGLVAGFFYGAGMLFQLLGLRYVTPSVSSFFTSLPVVFAPIAQSLFLRRPVSPRTWLAVAVALIGIATLSQTASTPADQPLTLAPPIPYLGHILTLLSALFFTALIISVDHFCRRGADSTRLTALMLASTCVLNLAASFLPPGHLFYRPSFVLPLFRDATFVWSMASLVVFSSVIAMHLMNHYQPLVSPATAAVIYCLEPVFGTLFSILFRTEKLTVLTLAGGTIILLAVLIVARTATPSEASNLNVER